MVKSFLRTLAAGLLLAAGTTPSVQAADLDWSFDNESYSRVSIIFFSQQRDWEWPGNDQVFYVDPHDGVRTMSLNCRQGEKICYGAWLDSNPNYYWGVGPRGTNGCDSCCYTCGGGATETISLISN